MIEANNTQLCTSKTHLRHLWASPSRGTRRPEDLHRGGGAVRHLGRPQARRVLLIHCKETTDSWAVGVQIKSDKAWWGGGGG